jgi:hypothetical protein
MNLNLRLLSCLHFHIDLNQPFERRSRFKFYFATSDIHLTADHDAECTIVKAKSPNIVFDFFSREHQRFGNNRVYWPIQLRATTIYRSDEQVQMLMTTTAYRLPEQHC